MITNVLSKEPFAVKTRIAHWKSEGGLNWIRISTLFESDADTSGVSQSAALCGPMQVFLDEENRILLSQLLRGNS